MRYAALLSIRVLNTNMNKVIHDISRPLSNATPVWPGDKEFELRWTMRRDQGDSVNVGQIASTLHVGTHLDAPLHFQDGGDSIDRLQLDAFVGPAQVVDVAGKTLIRIKDIERFLQPATQRLLLRTLAWMDPTQFPTSVPVIAPDVPSFLAGRGIRLLGVDVPSVDPIDSKTLDNHHALGRHSIAILESLDLSAVEPGEYELIAIPLKILGADASPVRAVLRSQ